jgi:hypothetical protein
MPNGKQGGTVVLRKGHDFVTGETCVPTSLNVNNLGSCSAAELCQSWPKMKAVGP